MANDFQPSYIRLHERGLLAGRVEQALALLEICRLCPRECGVNRLDNETGVCRTGRWANVSSFGPHFGEEDPLVGRNGSGTIFMANCNLLCVFCQNYDISHKGEGRAARPEIIAGVMIQLQELGCHNINFVTPSHVAPQILEALVPAVEAGLKVPLVYNSGGYDSVEMLTLLDGVFDIYMPDFKFWNDNVGKKYCGVDDYPERARLAVSEMHRQTGDLLIDENGLARRGLLVRHLVMPNGEAGTREVARFLAREISADTYINVMGQYRPCGRAYEFEELTKSLNPKERVRAKREAVEAGLTRLDERKRFPFGHI